MTRFALSAVLIAVGFVGVPAQEQRPSFDVASIRVNKSGQDFGYYDPKPGRFTATSMNVVELVGIAYRVPANRMILPDRVPSDRYDIQATYPSSPQGGGFADRLQRLLEERFALRVHRETRELPIYVLTRSRSDAKLGPTLVPMDVCTDGPKVSPSCGGLQYPGAGALVARRTWSDLALSEQLGRVLGRVVVDKTGLTGWFDFRLEWDPQSTSTAAPALPDRPPLFIALEEQLGLKLASARGPVEVLVIDSVQPPTEN